MGMGSVNVLQGESADADVPSVESLSLRSVNRRVLDADPYIPELLFILTLLFCDNRAMMMMILGFSLTQALISISLSPPLLSCIPHLYRGFGSLYVNTRGKRKKWPMLW